MKRLCPLFATVLSLLLLAGCSSQEEAQPLPASMEQTAVLTAGEEIFDQLLAGEYETVYDQFREDIRADLTVDDVRNLIEPVFEEAGAFEAIESSDTTGSTEGEEHGIARFLCVFSQEDVTVNVAFDPEMDLIGLSAGIRSSGWRFSNLVDNLTGLFGG